MSNPPMPNTTQEILDMLQARYGAGKPIKFLGGDGTVHRDPATGDYFLRLVLQFEDGELIFDTTEPVELLAVAELAITKAAIH